MENYYRTKDLYEASAIYSSEKKLLRLEKEERFYWFIFEGSECVKLADKYWTGEMNINAKAYADAIRSLKDRIFAQK